MPKFNIQTINKGIRIPKDMEEIIMKDAEHRYFTFTDYTREALIAYYDHRNGEYAFEHARTNWKIHNKKKEETHS